MNKHPHQIQVVFELFPTAEVILAGIRDTRTNAARNWEFKPDHLNIFHPEAIFIRNQPNLKITSLETLLQMMVGKRSLVYNYPIINITTTEAQPICQDVIDEYFESIEIKRRMYRRYFPDLQVMEYYPPRNMLLVGDKPEAIPLANCFMGLGWGVHCYFTKPDVHHKVNLAEIVGDSQNLDHIFIIHNYDAIDVSQVSKSIPIHFWTKQGVHPNLPLGWEGQGIFFHAYLGAVEQYKLCHPWAMSHTKQKELVPHGWYQPSFPITQQNKDIEFGFMGSIDSLPHPYDSERRDYLSVHMRDLRAKYIGYAKHHLGLQVFPRMDEAAYVHFLNRTEFILNVSGIFGLITERQFHAMACGGILVQNYFKYVDVLGYKHRVNCILFTSEMDLHDQMAWARANPIACTNIITRGKQLAQQHTLLVRAQQLRRSMLLYEIKDRKERKEKKE